MKKNICLFTLLVLTICHSKLFGQHTDSTQALGGIRHDTLYLVHENIPQNKLWGNSWYLATAYTYSKTNEFDFNLGRTYGSSLCGGAGCSYTMRSWGVGFGITTKNGQTSQLAKAFWEYCFFYFPPLSAGIRAEYMYDLSHNAHYLRPSVGLSFLYVDLFYNYSFNLNNTVNNFKHGVTLRLKYFYRRKYWQKNYPNRC